MEPAAVYPETALSFIGRTHEYADVYTYGFTPDAPVAYRAGQYGHVRLHGMPEGVKAVREFSFVSAPYENEIRFGIDGKSGSPYQKRLEELVLGEKVGLFKIKGHMSWPPAEVTHAVMIAGGIGVTPFRSMLADKKHANLPLSVTLLHIAHDDFLYEEELQTLADSYLMAHRDTFERSVDELAKNQKDAHFYIAGSPGFVDAAMKVLASRKISRIEADPFKGLPDS